MSTKRFPLNESFLGRLQISAKDLFQAEAAAESWAFAAPNEGTFEGN